MCSSQSGKNIMTSSRYSRVHCHLIKDMMTSIAIWKVTRALWSLYAMLESWYSRVENWGSFLTDTLFYLYLRVGAVRFPSRKYLQVLEWTDTLVHSAYWIGITLCHCISTRIPGRTHQPILARCKHKFGGRLYFDQLNHLYIQNFAIQEFSSSFHLALLATGKRPPVMSCRQLDPM